MEFEKSQIIFAFALTFFAALATGIGSISALAFRTFRPRLLAAALGLAAGVMIYVSLVEVFPEAKGLLTQLYGDKTGYWLTIFAFFTGIGLTALIDRLVPSHDDPHEIKSTQTNEKHDKLMRAGLFAAAAIALHNFPEGIAVFVSALENPSLGVSIAMAISIHNIPEGIAVAVPIYCATKSRKLAFTLSFASGLAQPLGALVGFLLLSFMNAAALGTILALTAGIMIYVAFDELLPTANKYGEHHVAVAGLIAGMAVMAIGLSLMA
ncbi:MAG: zinc transporter ZupT [Fibromonadaceae bacterium]|jgi:ZIP family zinc transporter|nr:zinc transporter ZupT [Fibromonadaceae bacterium]